MDARFTHATFAPAFDFTDGVQTDLSVQFGLEDEAQGSNTEFMRRSAAFDARWQQLEAKGMVDGIGGAEYQRRKQEWVTEGSPDDWLGDDEDEDDEQFGMQFEGEPVPWRPKPTVRKTKRSFDEDGNYIPDMRHKGRRVGAVLGAVPGAVGGAALGALGGPGASVAGMAAGGIAGSVLGIHAGERAGQALEDRLGRRGRSREATLRGYEADPVDEAPDIWTEDETDEFLALRKRERDGVIDDDEQERLEELSSIAQRIRSRRYGG